MIEIIIVVITVFVSGSAGYLARWYLENFKGDGIEELDYDKIEQLEYDIFDDVSEATKYGVKRQFAEKHKLHLNPDKLPYVLPEHSERIDI